MISGLGLDFVRNSLLLIVRVGMVVELFSIWW